MLGSTDGTVNITPGGGTPGYNYSWSNSATTQNLAAVGLGTYTVTVTDVNNCTKTTSATVNQPTAVTAIATETDAKMLCSTDGTVTLTLVAAHQTIPIVGVTALHTKDLAAVELEHIL